jgi:hypothetical protein
MKYAQLAFPRASQDISALSMSYMMTTAEIPQRIIIAAEQLHVLNGGINPAIKMLLA